MRVQRMARLGVLVVVFLVVTAPPALARETPVIQYESFLGWLLRPVSGLDHFLHKDFCRYEYAGQYGILEDYHDYLALTGR
jgi:hypothetical protein